MGKAFSLVWEHDGKSGENRRKKIFPLPIYRPVQFGEMVGGKLTKMTNLSSINVML